MCKKKKFTLLDHPPQSPDLNPIENVWNHVKKQIKKNYTMSNVEDIWYAFEEEWNKITPEICEKLIRSMPDRLQAVIDIKN